MGLINKMGAVLSFLWEKQHFRIIAAIVFTLLFGYLCGFGFLAAKGWQIYYLLRLAVMFLAVISIFFVWLKHSDLSHPVYVIGYGLLGSFIFDLFSFFSLPATTENPTGSLELSITYWLLARLTVLLSLIICQTEGSRPSRNGWLIGITTFSLTVAGLLNVYSSDLDWLSASIFGFITWKELWHFLHIGGFLIAIYLLHKRFQKKGDCNYRKLLRAAFFSIGIELCKIMPFTLFWSVLGAGLKVLVYYYLCSFVFVEAFVFPHKEVKRESKKFKRERDMLAALINSIIDEIWFCDTLGNVILANPAALKNLSEGELGGMLKAKRSLPLCEPLFPLKQTKENKKQEALLNALKGDTVQFVEKAGVSGKSVYNHVVAAPVKSENGGVSGAVCVVRDISVQKKTEEELRLSEERFARIFQANPGLVSIIRLKDRKYIDVNPSWEKNTGYSRREVIGRTEDELKIFFEEDGKKQAELVQVINKRVRYTTKSGWVRTGLMTSDIFEVDGEECILNTIYDTTEIDCVDKEIARLDRLDIVGQMAVAIGHEIRNPMTTVRGYLQLMREREETSINNGRYELMIRELDRANAIITDFLFLANDKRALYIQGDLNTIIKGLYPELSGIAGLEHKEIILKLGDIPTFLLDAGEIKMLAVNLVKNALEATERGGRVIISTFIDEGDVVLAVEDCGTGISPDIREKIGLPFISTKEHGTGLGLAICYSVAKRHGARISFDTGPGGSTFFVRFSPESPLRPELDKQSLPESNDPVVKGRAADEGHFFQKASN